MRAFEISLNGKKLCVAGVGNDGVLSAVVDWVVKPEHGDLDLTVGGLISYREHVYWIRREPLDVNDEIKVRIIEADQVEEPVHRQPNPAEPSRDRHIGGIIGPY
jgi:hypothetical protein